LTHSTCISMQEIFLHILSVVRARHLKGLSLPVMALLFSGAPPYTNQVKRGLPSTVLQQHSFSLVAHDKKLVGHI
jgi:hypothetical protein